MKSFFISSTFKDMQAERDILHQQVFPEIRRFLKPYGEDIQELDLRWGVDTSLMTEEESGYHVIESCIDSIDRCRPYMIILIGERYGWIPDAAAVANTHDTRLTAWYNESISITQMEILYGALEQGQMENCIFCFRDGHFSDSLPPEMRSIYQAESDVHRKKLAALKEKIRRTAGAEIFEYSPFWDGEKQQVSGLSDFAEELCARLKRMLSREFADRQAACPEEAILQDAALTAARYMSSYIPRENLGGERTLTGRSAVWYYGAGGCGKSAFLSDIFDGARATGAHAFIYYCGNENCNETDTFLSTLLYWLRREKGDAAKIQTEPKNRTQKLQWILKLLTMPRNCDSILLIDGADQMEEDITDILAAIAKTVIRDKVGQYTCGLAVTSTDTYYHAHAARLKAAAFAPRAIGGLTAPDVVAVAQLHARRRGKHLDPRAQNAIRQKADCGNPYYLSLLLQQLFMMDEDDFRAAERLAPGMEGLSLYMCGQIEHMPSDLTAMTVRTLGSSAERLHRRFSDIETSAEAADPMLLFRLIAVSRRGLTMREIEDLTARQGRTLLPMETQRLFCFLYDAFCENREGRWNFSHRLLRESLLSGLTAEENRRLTGLLYACARENGNIADAFFYALRMEDAERIAACLADAAAGDERVLSAFVSAFRAHLLQIPADAAPADPLPAGDFAARFAAMATLQDPDGTVDRYDVWCGLLNSAAEKAVSDETLCAVLSAQFSLLKYGDTAGACIDCLTRLRKRYMAIPSPDAGVTDAYFMALLTVPVHPRLMSAGPEIGAYIRELQTHTGRDLSAIADLLSRIADADQAPRGEAAAARTALHNQLTLLEAQIPQKEREDYTPVEKCLAHMITSQWIALADRYSDAGQYGDAFAILKKLDVRLTPQIQLLPTADERIQYADFLAVLMGCIKPHFAIKQIDAYRAQWETLAARSPLPSFRRGLGYSYYLEASILEKWDRAGQTEVDHDRRLLMAYREAIRIYDSLLEGKSDEEKDLIVLDMAIFMRQKRIRRRLEQDLWNWEDDKEINIGKPNAWFEEMMETDLRRCAGDLRLLQKREGTDRRHELLRAHLYAMQYRDRRQEKDTMLTACDALLALDTELKKEDPKSGNMTRAEIYLDAAEALERWGESERACDLARQSLACADFVGAATRKLEEPLRRVRVRAYLLLMKTEAAQDPGKGEEYFRLAWDQTTEIEGEREAFPEKENYLRSDLKQTLAEIFHRSGNTEAAVTILRDTADYWPALPSMGIPGNEPKVQRKFRFLQGQALLGRILKDEALLKAVIGRLKVTVETRTPDKDSARRPLLLAEARMLEQFYTTELPDTPIPENLMYILQITEPVRRQYRLDRGLSAERDLLDAIAAWEREHDDITDLQYAALLKKTAKHQSALSKEADKDSEVFAQLFARRMQTDEKLTAHYWAIGDHKAALYCERAFTAYFQHQKSLMERLYPARNCLDRWLILRERRTGAPFVSRTVQLDWIYVTAFAMDICGRLYEETGDAAWLRRAAREATDYRAYMRGHLASHTADLDWILEMIHNFCAREQEVYLRLCGSGKSPEEDFLPAYLDSVWEQLQIQMQVRLPSAASGEMLDRLYRLQAAPLRDQAGIQKAIDAVSAARGNTDRRFLYYVQKAARDLPAGTTSEEFAAYVENLQKQEGSGQSLRQ